MAVYVGRWDCNTCGYKGILGPKTACPNCGSPRPKGVVFYQAAEKDIVQDPEVLRQAKAGADWKCSYCSGHNKAWEKKCTTCGNPRNAAQGDASLATKEYSLADVPTSGEIPRKRVEHPDQIKPKKKSKVGLLIGVGVLVFGLLIFLLGYTKETTVSVASFEWERTIEVEQNREVTKEGWEVPQGGRMINQYRAIHHYDKILEGYETRTRTVREEVGTEQYVCGTRSLGNGYMEDKYCTRKVYENREEEYEEPIYRKEAVYRQKYKYTIYEWTAVNPLLTSGKNHDAQWANTQAIEQDPNQRVRNKRGKYLVFVKDKKQNIHQEEVPLEKWKSYQIGQELKAKEGIGGGYRGLIN